MSTPPPHAGAAAGLALHVLQCRRSRGRWFGPALWAERAHGWAGPRFVTTVALASIALVSLSHWR